ncbi:hypothetical protein CLAIMM_02578 [Cladophialophora immunda]|nr:hypothetical protein CLAIMM_02578 [Cladophialophora immunda]
MSSEAPLKGLKVLELGGLAPSPFAGLILADYGADVVRVDRPFEVFGPPRDTLCRRKRSVVIDLKQEPRGGRSSSWSRSPTCSSTLTGRGSRHAWVSARRRCAGSTRASSTRTCTGSGRTGSTAPARPRHQLPRAAGILSVLGRRDENPAPPANILGDFAGGGLVCVAGILMALLHRHASGRGQLVAANMVDGAAYLATFMRQQQGHANNDRPRGENLLDGAAPFYEVYRTRDARFVAVGAQEPQFYHNLLAGLGLADGGSTEKLPEQWDRTAWPRMKELFARTFAQKTMREWAAVFDSVDACVTPVLNMDETEAPFRPLVELSDSPSLDVHVQESYPELKKGAGSEEVLREWIPWSKASIHTDPSSKLLSMRREAKL